jgi:hypothetical protein
MNGMPHNAKVPLLGFADTIEEAKHAASEVFDVWLERAGLMIAPPAERTPSGRVSPNTGS